MNTRFETLPWHDAILLSLIIDRSSPGENDTVVATIEWEDGAANRIIFTDCYFLEARMNFGIIAEEAIVRATCSDQGVRLHEIKKTWRDVGVELTGLRRYCISTSSTNSDINIYALSFSML